MADEITEIAGRPVLLLAADGPPISAGSDVPDIIGQTWGTGADLVIIPAGRLAG